MKFQNIEAIIFIFILFFLIMWGLPKCRSNSQPAAAAPEAVVATPPQLPQSPPATTGTSTATVAPTGSTMSPVTETPSPVNPPSAVSRLMPKPMNVRTVQRPAARPAPVVSTEQTVPFNPTGGNAGETVSESGVKNVWTVTSDVKLRGTPGLDGKLLGKIPKGIQLTYLNIKTDKTQRLTIDGIEQDEPWLKVRTPRGTVGWVYGGVVRFYKK